MKHTIFFLMLMFIGTIFVSCENSANLPPSMQPFVGTYDAVLTVGSVLEADVVMEVTPHNGHLRVLVPETFETVEVLVEFDSTANDTLFAIPCNDCIGGHFPITRGKFYFNSDDKRRMRISYIDEYNREKYFFVTEK